MKLSTFNYESNEIRVVLNEQTNIPYWVAKDICDVLGHTNSRMAMQALDEDEKGVSKVYTLGGEQTLQTVNESGLYTLILRSNKPEAKPFKRWVTHEVLPTIRKTGKYDLNNHSIACYPIEVEPNKIVNIYRNKTGGFIIGDGSVNSLLKADVLKLIKQELGQKALKVLLRAMIPILNTPEALEDERIDQDDTLSGFIECYIVQDQNARTKSRDVYEAYLKWCSATNVEPLKMPLFTAKFKTYRIGIHKTIRFDDGQSKGYIGFTVAPMGGAL